VWVVVHLYSGLALGAAIPAPYWALVLIVLAAHVALDLVPHWDYTRTRHPVIYGSLDFGVSLVTLIVGYFVFHAGLPLLALGVISAAPDFDVVYNAARGRAGDYWFPSHRKGFPHGRCKPLPGILTQAVVVAASCVALALA
jgi:hypothetical protein